MAPVLPNTSGDIPAQVSTDDLTLWGGSQFNLEFRNNHQITYTILNQDPDNAVNLNIVTWTRPDMLDLAVPTNYILNPGLSVALLVTAIGKNVAVQIQSTAAGMPGTVIGGYWAF